MPLMITGSTEQLLKDPRSSTISSLVSHLYLSFLTSHPPKKFFYWGNYNFYSYFQFKIKISNHEKSDFDPLSLHIFLLRNGSIYNRRFFENQRLVNQQKVILHIICFWYKLLCFSRKSSSKKKKDKLKAAMIVEKTSGDHTSSTESKTHVADQQEEATDSRTAAEKAFDERRRKTVLGKSLFKMKLMLFSIRWKSAPKRWL